MYGLITDLVVNVESCYNISALQSIDTTGFLPGRQIYCQQVGLFNFDNNIENLSNYDVLALNSQGSWRLNKQPIISIDNSGSISPNNLNFHMINISANSGSTTYNYYDVRITTESILIPSMNNNTNNTYVAAQAFPDMVKFTFSTVPGIFQINLWIYNPMNTSTSQQYLNLARLQYDLVINRTPSQLISSTDLVSGQYYSSNFSNIYTFSPMVVLNNQNILSTTNVVGSLVPETSPWILFNNENNSNNLSPHHFYNYFSFIGNYTQSGSASQIFITLSGTNFRVGQPVFLQILSIATNVRYKAQIVFNDPDYQLLVQWSSAINNSNFNYLICN